MSWAADEWKDGLPQKALIKITDLEGQLERIKKERDAKQFKLESLEQVFDNQKRKTETEKSETVQLKRENKSLSEKCAELENSNQKLANDLLSKENELTALGKNATELQIAVVDRSTKNSDEIPVESQNQIKALEREVHELKQQLQTVNKSNEASHSTQTSELQKCKQEIQSLQLLVSELEGKNKSLIQEKECLRHNGEATRLHIESKLKEREKELKDDAARAMEMTKAADRQLQEIQAKSQQEFMFMQTEQNKLKSLVEKLEREKCQFEKEGQDMRHRLNKAEESKVADESLLADLQKKCASIEMEKENKDNQISGQESTIRKMTDRTLALEKELNESKTTSEKMEKLSSTLKTDLEAAQAKNLDIQAKYELVQANCEVKVSEINKLEATCQEKSSKLLERETEVEKLLTEIKSSQEHKLELEREVSVLKSELTAKSSVIAEIESKCTALNQQLVEKEEVMSVQTKTYEDNLATLEQTKQLCEQEMKAVEERHDSVLEQLVETKQALNTEESKYQQLQDEFQSISKSKSDSDQALAEVKLDLDVKLSSLHDLEEKYKRALKDVQDWEDKFSLCLSEKSECIAKLQEAEECMSTMQEDIQTKSLHINEGELKFSEIKQELLRKDEENEALVKEKTEALQVVEEMKTEHENAKAELDEKLKSILKEMELANKCFKEEEDSHNVAKVELEQLRTVQKDLTSSLDLVKRELEDKVLHVESSDKLITSLREDLCEKNLNISELQNQLQTIQSEKTEVETNQKEIEERYAAMEKEYSVTNERCHLFKAELIQLKKECEIMEQAKEKIQDLEVRLTELGVVNEAKALDFSTRIETLTTELEAKTLTCAETEKECMRLKEELQSKESDCNVMNSQIQVVQDPEEKINALECELSSQNERLQESNSHNDKLKEEVLMKEAKLNDLIKLKSDLEEEKSSFETKMHGIEQSLQTALSELAASEDMLKTEETAHLLAREKLAQLEAQYSDLEQTLNSLKVEMSTKESMFSKTEQDYESTIQSLLEKSVNAEHLEQQLINLKMKMSETETLSQAKLREFEDLCAGYKSENFELAAKSSILEKEISTQREENHKWQGKQSEMEIQLREMKTEMENKEQLFSIAEDKYEEVSGKLQAKCQELVCALFEKYSSDNQAEDLTKKVHAAELELNKKNSVITDLEMRCTALTEEMSAQNEEYKTCQGKQLEMEVRLEAMKSDLEDKERLSGLAEEKYQEMSGELQAKCQELVCALFENNSKDDDVADLTKKVHASELELNKKDSVIADLETRCTALTEEMSAQSGEFLKCQGMQLEMEKKLKGMRSDLENKERLFDIAEEEQEKLSTKLQAKCQELVCALFEKNSRDDELEILTMKMQTAEIELNKKDSVITDLEMRCAALTEEMSAQSEENHKWQGKQSEIEFELIAMKSVLEDKERLSIIAKEKYEDMLGKFQAKCEQLVCALSDKTSRDNEAEDLTKKLKAAELELNKKDSVITDLETRCTALTKEISAQSEEYHNWQEKQSEMEDKLEAMRSELEDKERLSSSAEEKYEEISRELQAKCQELVCALFEKNSRDNELEDLTKKVYAAELELNKKNSVITDLEMRCTALTEEMSARSEEYNKWQVKQSEMEDNLEAMRSELVDKRLSSIAEADQNLVEDVMPGKDYQDYIIEIDSLKEKVNQSEFDILELNCLLEQAEGEKETIVIELNAVKKGNADLEAHLLQTQKQNDILEQQLSDLRKDPDLTQQFEQASSEEIDMARESVYLHEVRAELNFSVMEPSEMNSQANLSQTDGFNSNFSPDLISENKTLKAKVGNLESEIIQLRVLSKDFDRFITDLDAKNGGDNSELNSKLQQLQLDLTNLEAERAELSQHNKELTASVCQAQEENKTLEQKIVEAHGETKDLGSQLMSLKNVIHTLNDRHDQKGKDILDKVNEIEKLRTESSELLDKIQKKQEEIDVLAEEVAKLRYDLKESKSNTGTLEDVVESLNIDITALEEEKVSLCDNLETLRVKIKDLECELSEQKRINEELQSSCGENSRVLELNIMIEKLKTDNMKLSHELEEIEKLKMGEKQLRMDIAEVENLRAVLSAELESVQSELAGKHSQCEDLGLQVSDCQSEILLVRDEIKSVSEKLLFTEYKLLESQAILKDKEQHLSTLSEEKDSMFVELSARDRKIDVLITEKETVQMELEMRKNELDMAQVNNISAQDYNQKIEENEMLKSSNEILLSTLSEKEDIIRILKRENEMHDSLNEANDLLSKELKQKSSEILALQDAELKSHVQILDLKKCLSEKENELKNFLEKEKQSTESLTERNNSLHKEVKEKIEEICKLQDAELKFQTQLMELENCLLEKEETHKNILLSEKKSFREEKDLLNKKLKDKLQQISELEGTHQEREKEVADLIKKESEARDSLKENIISLTRKLKEREEELSLFQNKNHKLLTQMSELETCCADLKLQMNHKKEESEKLASLNNKLQKMESHAQEADRTHKKEFSEAQSKMKEMEQTHTAALAQALEAAAMLEKENKALSDKLESQIMPAADIPEKEVLRKWELRCKELDSNLTLERRKCNRLTEQINTLKASADNQVKTEDLKTELDEVTRDRNQLRDDFQKLIVITEEHKKSAEVLSSRVRVLTHMLKKSKEKDGKNSSKSKDTDSDANSVKSKKNLCEPTSTQKENKLSNKPSLPESRSSSSHLKPESPQLPTAKVKESGLSESSYKSVKEDRLPSLTSVSSSSCLGKSDLAPSKNLPFIVSPPERKKASPLSLRKKSVTAAPGNLQTNKSLVSSKETVQSAAPSTDESRLSEAQSDRVHMPITSRDNRTSHTSLSSLESKGVHGAHKGLRLNSGEGTKPSTVDMGRSTRKRESTETCNSNIQQKLFKVTDEDPMSRLDGQPTARHKETEPVNKRSKILTESSGPATRLRTRENKTALTQITNSPVKKSQQSQSKELLGEKSRVTQRKALAIQRQGEEENPQECNTQ